MKKMMIKTSTLVFVFFFVGTFAQKKMKDKDIMKSTNIEQIETFLKTAHPHDPRNKFLKNRIIHLKNEDWVKGKYTAKPMEARLITMDSIIIKPIDSTDIIEKEFLTQFELEKQNHRERTTHLLNTLFDNQKNSPDVAILIKNNSKCNIVVKVNGSQTYQVAIPKFENNTLVVQKGNYSFTSKVCNTPYISSKNIQKSTLINLNEVEYKK